MISSARSLAGIPSEAETAAGDGDPVALAQAGDLEAFENLYHRYVGRIYALCLRMIADPQQAESLTQDAFVRAWSKLKSFRGEGDFGAWLHRLTINTVIEDRRKAAREREILASPRPWGGNEHGGDRPEAGFPASMARATDSDAGLDIDLERAMAALPAGARQVFILHDVEGYRLREIAGMKKVTVGGVKAQLHRARRLLRNSLDPESEVKGHEA